MAPVSTSLRLAMLGSRSSRRRDLVLDQALLEGCEDSAGPFGFLEQRPRRFA